MTDDTIHKTNNIMKFCEFFCQHDVRCIKENQNYSHRFLLSETHVVRANNNIFITFNFEICQVTFDI